MKKLGIYYLYFIIALGFTSCSNDFLHEGLPKGPVVADTLFMNDLDSQKVVSFNLPSAGNARWRIYKHPAWMEISPLEGHFSEGNSAFEIKSKGFFPLRQPDTIPMPLVFEVDGLGLVEYPILFTHYGRPVFALSTYDILFYYRSIGQFIIHNYKDGVLVWEINDQPSWINVSKQKGILQPNQSETISLLVSRENVGKGSYTGTINIANNSIDPNRKVKVSMNVSFPTKTGIQQNIEGKVVDADFCKGNGLMVVATTNPNRIYFYRPDQPVKSVELQKKPLAIDLSETGDQLAATFTNADLSLIDAERMTIITDIAIGTHSPEVVLGSNGWAYLAPTLYESSYLKSVNLATGQIITHTKDMDGLTLLKKVPGKSLLYGSLPGWDPDKLFVFDISTGEANNVVDDYNMTLRKFWLSEDGQYLFSGNGKVYQSPNYTNSGHIIGTPVLNREFAKINGLELIMDHCTFIKEMFVCYDSNKYGEGTQVLQINDSGSYIKSAFLVNKIFTDKSGNTIEDEPVVPFMFVNKLGTELHLIKKWKANNGEDYWFYEKISLTNK